MALNKIDGAHQARDEQLQRIGLGTIGGDHVQQGALDGFKIQGVTDDRDPSVIYGFSISNGGSAAGTAINVERGAPFDIGGTSTRIAGLGAAFQTTFKGTKVGILGRLNRSSCNLRVYIDGIETPGRSLTLCQLNNVTYGPGTNLSATATTIDTSLSGLPSLFPAPGIILIGSEQISYSAVATVGGIGQFQGCVRGINGTTAQEHVYTETIYQWTSRPTAFSGLTNDYSMEQLLWLNQFLPDGEHTITAVLMDDATTGNNTFFFDGFLTGPLIGNSQIFHNVATYSVTVTTDANGYADLAGAGNGMFTREGLAIIGLLGWNQVSPDPKTGATMAKLICYPNNQPSDRDYLVAPRYGIVNGAASTTYSVQLVFSYLADIT